MGRTEAESPLTSGRVLTIAYSERLGQLTDHERRIERELSTAIEIVPLWSLDEIERSAAGADAVFVGAVEPMDREALSKLTKCRMILRRGVGVDNIDLKAATDLGIVVAYVPNASVQEVSDHALAMLLALERRTGTFDKLVKSRQWTKTTDTVADARRDMRRLSRLTLGIVGFGRIGQELARKSQPLFARQVVFDPFLSESADLLGCAPVSFDELLGESDLISIHAPLTDANHHLFNDEAFRKVKPGCTIVNTSRGGLIDTAALVSYLQNGSLRAAGLDVTEVEPIEHDSPLLGLTNVLLTAHSAAFSVASSEEARETLVRAVLDGFNGRDPQFVANPEVLSRADCRLRTMHAYAERL